MRAMSKTALCSLDDERLGPEWTNLSLSRATFLPEDIFAGVVHLVPVDLQTRYLQADEDRRVEVLFEEIFSHLNTLSPAGCYFGAHPGSASDFGFWELPQDELEPTAHAVVIRGRKRYFRYDVLTDAYCEEIPDGDLMAFKITASLNISAYEAYRALGRLEEQTASAAIKTYIHFLERLCASQLGR